MSVRMDDAVTCARMPPGRGLYRAISVIVGLVATVSILFYIARVLTISTGHALFTIGGTDSRLPLSVLPQLQQADLRPGSSGTLADAALSLRLLCASPYFVAAVTVAVATVFVFRVMKSVAAAQPFGSRALNGWRWLTITLLAGGILQGVASTMAVLHLLDGVGLAFGSDRGWGPWSVTMLGGDYQNIGVGLPQWPITLIVAGLVALSLTAAFRIGARLQKDLDGVV